MNIDYHCLFDGATEPKNPGGHIGTGSIIFTNKKEIVWQNSTFKEASPKNSNNVAEYMALIEILKYFNNSGIVNKIIKIYGDSKLVINQMLGLWNIKEGLYVKYAKEAKNLLLKSNNRFQFQWIPREKNEVADRLSKEELIKRNIGITIRKQRVG